MHLSSKSAFTRKKLQVLVSVPLTKDCLHQKPIPFGGHFFETSCPCKCISQQKQSFFHDQFLLTFTVVCHHLYSCMKCRVCTLFSWDCFIAHITLMHQFCWVGVVYLPTFSSMLTYHNKHWLWRKQYWSCVTVPSILITTTNWILASCELHRATSGWSNLS